MRKQRIPVLTTSALGFIAICIIVIGAWGIFPGAMSQTLTPQDQVSAAGLSSAIEAQRQASAKLTGSASFDQRFQKLSDKAQKKGTVPVILKVRAAFRPEGQISNPAELLAQRKVIEEAQDQILAGLRYVPSTLKSYEYVPYIAASVDATDLEQLQSSSEALDVFEDKPMRLALSESLPRVGSPRAWAGGFTGAGKTIAVLDGKSSRYISQFMRQVRRRYTGAELLVALDQDLAHTSKSRETKRAFRQLKLHWISPPKDSPDNNPVETIFSDIQQMILGMGNDPDVRTTHRRISAHLRRRNFYRREFQNH